MSAGKHVIGNFLTKLAVFPIGFISSIFIARYLGPEDRGLAAFLTLAVAFLLPVISLGMAAGIRYQVSSKRYTPADALPNCIVISLFFGLLGVIVIYGSWSLGVFGSTGEQISRLQIVLICCAFVFQSIYFFLTRLLTGASRFPLINGIHLCKGIFYPMLMLGMVWFFAMRVDGVAVAILTLSVLLTIFVLVRCIRDYGLRFEICGRFISLSFSYGIRSWLGDITVRANTRLDQVFLAATIAPFGLGIYSVAVVLAEIIWLIPNSIGPVLFNKIADASNHKTSMDMTARMLRLLFFPSVMIAVVLYFCTKYVLIPYGYGSEYSELLLPLSILLFGSVLIIPAKVFTKLFSGSGNVLYSSYATAIGSIISVFLYFLLIPKYGLIGASIASSIGYATVSVVCLAIYRKQNDSRMASLFYIQWNDFRWVRAQLTGIKSP